MTRRDRIDGVTIEADENGFHLFMSGEESEYNFLLDGTIAMELMRAVRMEIEPWAAEGEAISREQALAYDPGDPKHPTYHDRMSEIWDSREGK